MKKLILIILIALVNYKVSGQYLTSYQVSQVKSMINTAIAPLNTSINSLKIDVANKTLQIKALQDSINSYYMVSDTTIGKGRIIITKIRENNYEIYSQ